MTDREAVGLIAMFSAMGAVYITCIIALYVLQVIANWKIFTKAGEAGWKAIIPVYNEFILFKISWKTSYFWIMLVLSVLASILSEFRYNRFCMVLCLIACIAIIVLYIMQMDKLAKSFGYGVGFTLALIFFNPIAMLVLGFGNAQYIGNTTE